VVLLDVVRAGFITKEENSRRLVDAMGRAARAGILISHPLAQRSGWAVREPGGAGAGVSSLLAQELDNKGFAGTSNWRRWWRAGRNEQGGDAMHKG
jgi:hypothetical protein